MPGIRLLAVAGLALGIAPRDRAATAPEDCTLVAEAASGRVVVEQGSCDERESPASTFKVPLALIGFDAGILTSPHEPAWPYDSSYRYWDEAGRRSIDPTSWLGISVVWYSELLVSKLGDRRFGGYVERLHYGNGDLSGGATAPGVPGLPPAVWVSSSLRISPKEQLAFLRRMLRRQLGLERRAYELTEASMPQFPLPDGSIVRGKTGTGSERLASGALDPDHHFGWFIGWVTHRDRPYVFVRLIRHQDGTLTPRAGLRARSAVLADLPAILAKAGS